MEKDQKIPIILNVCNCNEKDENKLLKNTFKNRIICKNCYDIIIDMTKPYRNK